MNTSIDKLFI